jgi:hypothetical protein
LAPAGLLAGGDVADRKADALEKPCHVFAPKR